MSSNENGTEGSGPEAEHNQAKMSPETRERIEGLMHDMIEGGLWGYKNKTDPTEREVAFQSEATAEKLFSYLYADDPTNAKKKWQEYSGKPADKGLISRRGSHPRERPQQGCRKSRHGAAACLWPGQEVPQRQ